MDLTSQQPAGLLAAIVSASGDAIVSSDVHERFTTWNPAAERLFGYTASEAIGQPATLIVPPGFDDERRAALRQAASGDLTVRFETRRRRKDGSLVDVAMSLSAIRDQHGAVIGFVTIVRDISARKAVAAALAAANERTHEILERITDGFYALDREWRFTYINHTTERFLGRSRHELLGKNIWEEIPAAVETGLYDAAHRAMNEGVTTSFELVYEPLDAWVEGRVYPSANGISLFYRDITEQMRSAAAMTELVARLQASNRELTEMSSTKSDYLSMISHEFRTPLTSIQGFSELLASDMPSPEEVQHFVATINRSAQRLTRMVDDVLDLDRLEAGMVPLQVQSLSLNDTIQGVVTTLRHTTTHHRFELRLDPTLPRICGDPDLIGRLVANLVANAIKFSPAGGPIRLWTAHHGDEVELAVEDEGIGIPADRLETVFARYSRVPRPEQIGIEVTGLGLPIARAIVTLHGGRIWAERREPAGTNLRVTLSRHCPES